MESKDLLGVDKEPEVKSKSERKIEPAKVKKLWKPNVNKSASKTAKRRRRF